jgi:hypothetical protein
MFNYFRRPFAIFLLCIPVLAQKPPSPVLGRWTDGHISSIQYRDSVTGVGAPTNGRSFAYEFKPDGTYSFTGLMQSVMYNCTTSMFSNETGTYTMDGDAVSLRPRRIPIGWPTARRRQTARRPASS